MKYVLTGHFHQVLSYTEANGYCNGTGYVEDADFTVAAGASIEVKLQSPFAAGAAALPNLEPGSWKLTGQVAPEGSECS